VKQKQIYRFLLLLTPTLVVLVAVSVLMIWRIPTRVELNITANQTVFVLGGSSSSSILYLPNFQSLTFEKFAQITMNPEKLEMADWSQYIQVEDRYPESAWTLLTFTNPIVITSLDQRLQPALTIEGATPGQKAVGTLDRFWGKPGARVTITVRDVRTAYLTVEIEDQKTSMNLLLYEPFQMIIEYGSISGITGLTYPSDSITYRAQLSSDNPELKITGQPNSLIFMVTISPVQVVNISPKGGIPITTIDFTRQVFKDPKGERETTLVEDGELTYPGYPNIERIPIKVSEFIGLDVLKKFRIEQIMIDPKSEGVKFRLSGIATHISTGTYEFSKDYRLTQFDQLWKNKQLVIVFSIIVWVFPTTVAAVRLYKYLNEI
jgi:hypothetical protein